MNAVAIAYPLVGAGIERQIAIFEPQRHIRVVRIHHSIFKDKAAYERHRLHKFPELLEERP
jgi:ribosomal protein L19